MTDIFDRPILSMLFVCLLTHRVVLWCHPGVRRWRAARDLAVASAMEAFKAAFDAELRKRNEEFGVERNK